MSAQPARMLPVDDDVTVDRRTPWDPGDTGSMSEYDWRRLVVSQFNAGEARFDQVEKSIAANTGLTQQVLEETLAIRTAVVRGRWLARATTAVVGATLRGLNLLARWAAPIVAVVLAILAYFGIKFGGTP